MERSYTTHKRDVPGLGPATELEALVYLVESTSSEGRKEGLFYWGHIARRLRDIFEVNRTATGVKQRYVAERNLRATRSAPAESELLSPVLSVVMMEYLGSDDFLDFAEEVDALQDDVRRLEGSVKKLTRRHKNLLRQKHQKEHVK